MDFFSLADSLADSLPSKTVDAALRIARSDAIDAAESEVGYVSAIIHGTSSYSVSLTAHDDRALASCTCPAFSKWGPCKHVLALLLWARDTEFVSHGRSADGGVGSATEISQAEQRTAMLRKAWRSRVGFIRRDAASHRQRSLSQAAQRSVDVILYELNAGWNVEDETLEVGVRSAKLGRNGQPTRGKALAIPRIDIDHLPDRLDRRIVRMLQTLRDDSRDRYSYALDQRTAAIKGSRARSLLRLLARTGRCFLSHNGREAGREAPLHLDPGGPWEPTFLRDAIGDGTVALEIELARESDGERLSLTRINTWFLPWFFLWGTRLCEIRSGSALPWIHDTIARGAILVPEEQLKEFTTEVLAGNSVPRGIAPELEIERNVPAQPVLAVNTHDGRSQPIGTLHFEYDGARVALHDASEIVSLDAVSASGSLSGPRFLARDMGAEESAFRRLLAIPGIQSPKMSEAYDVLFVRAHFAETLGQLIALGWHVELQGERVRAPGVFAGSVRSGRDWFDLEGGYDYGGQIVPLPDVLKASRKGQSMLRLADGSHALVPASFEDSWGVLTELAQSKDGTLRFARSQGWLLDALLTMRKEIEPDADFAAHRKRLAAFDGVPAVRESRSFDGNLRDYQRDGLGWLEFLREFGCGGCLADDMGLGKTIQVLASLDRLRARRKLRGPSLVVAPRSVVFNWMDETRKFAPKLRALEYVGGGRAALRKRFSQHDLIVTTYGTLRRDVRHLAEIEFDHVILDEAQAIKNPQSQGFKAARVLRARHRLALTGTPVENRLSDLWTIFEFLNPGMLGRSTTFRRISSGTGKRRATQSDSAGGAAADGGRSLIARAVRPFLLRRTKDQVASDLPARSEQVIHCAMTKPQKELYAQVRDHYRSTLLAKDGGGEGSGGKMMVLEALLRLRQAACHADLVGGAVTGGTAGKGTGDAASAADRSGKLDTLMPLLEEASSGGHKALVFSQFTGFLALLRARLDASNTSYLYLDGKTRDRKTLVNAFQNDPDRRLFLISLKAGGVGLNLTAADYVFLLDPWWNPAVEAQAIDRTHRIGQTRAVMAYRLISTDTVEEKVLALQAEKRDLAASVLSQDNALLSNLSREDLELLLT